MGLCPRLSQLQTASPRVAHLHAPLQLASSSCQYRTTASDQQNRPDQGQPVETPHLEPATPTAAGSDAHERQRPALPLVSRRHVLVAEGSIGPSPAGRDHQRLKVVLAGNADRNGAVIPMVIVDLVTRHRAAGNETDES